VRREGDMPHTCTLQRENESKYRSCFSFQYITGISRENSRPLTPKDRNTGNTVALLLTDSRQEALQSSTTSQCQALANLPLALAAKSLQVLKVSPKSQSKAAKPVMRSTIIYTI